VLRRTYSRQHTHISIAIVVAFLIAAATAYASRTFTAGPVVPNVVRTIQLDIQHPLGARYTGGAHHVSSQWHHSKGYSAAMLPYAGFMFMCITLARNSLQGRGPVTSKAIYQKSIVVQCVPSAVMPPVQMQIPSLEPARTSSFFTDAHLFDAGRPRSADNASLLLASLPNICKLQTSHALSASAAIQGCEEQSPQRSVLTGKAQAAFRAGCSRQARRRSSSKNNSTAAKAAKRSLGARLHKAPEPQPLVMSYDPSRLRTKIQNAVRIPCCLRVDCSREFKAPLTSRGSKIRSVELLETHDVFHRKSTAELEHKQVFWQQPLRKPLASPWDI